MQIPTFELVRTFTDADELATWHRIWMSTEKDCSGFEVNTPDGTRPMNAFEQGYAETVGCDEFEALFLLGVCPPLAALLFELETAGKVTISIYP